jgi:hypothetical protein
MGAEVWPGVVGCAARRLSCQTAQFMGSTPEPGQALGNLPSDMKRTKQAIFRVRRRIGGGLLARNPNAAGENREP